jgi:hypothetical protein
MQKFKKRWEISKNWQLIHPFLGILAALFSGYFLGKRIIGLFPDLEGYIVIILLGILSVSLGYLFICISLWCFKKLENKWLVNYRWEFIAIFLCFAVQRDYSWFDILAYTNTYNFPCLSSVACAFWVGFWAIYFFQSFCLKDDIPHRAGLSYFQV